MTSDTAPQPLPMSDFDYELPPDLIAQTPLERRSDSRLLVLDRSQPDVVHAKFSIFPELLNPNDVLIFNDTRVIPARLHGQRESGGKLEFLLLKRIAEHRWNALAKPAARLRVGERVLVANRSGQLGPGAQIVEKLEDGEVVVDLDTDVDAHLDNFGDMPLPPYITERLEDDNRYQTVYSKVEGSAAAPTAGLHFTDETFEQLARRGIETGFVTLHVGLDTFRPVTEDDARSHKIHREWCALPQSVVDLVARAKAQDGRVVAVGTTTARTLETWGKWTKIHGNQPFIGDSSIYITPGYEWTVVDGLLTNFHLPKSTLLLMVSALAGRERILGAYRNAVEERYRFFSFGDAMLIV